MLELQEALSKCGFNHADIFLLTIDKYWICSEFASEEIKALAFELAKVEKQISNSMDSMEKKILRIKFELLEMLLEKSIREYINRRKPK